MFDLKELLSIQRDFADSLTHKPTLAQYVFAMNIEVAELLNKLPWKWWKKKQDVIKEDVLDELADVLAFWLSAYNLIFKNLPKAIVTDPQFVLDHEIDVIQTNINYGIARELQNTPSKIEDLNTCFESPNTIVSPATAGRRLGSLIGYTMRVSGASITDVVQAYKVKMEENYNRQKRGY